ncbi:MAG: amidohydrolase family protein, partial [Lentisphaerae bacterium]|nr:amidohydrolase family protein [Lentisphaerota bacterium]
ELCLSSCPRGFLESLVARVPLQKIVWGTDQMLINPAHQLGRVLFARITPDQKRAILGENAARILEPSARQGSP